MGGFFRSAAALAALACASCSTEEIVARPDGSVPTDDASTDATTSPDFGPVDPEEPPVVPVGYDAFRAWDRWPSLRLGVRAYMRSTFDRTGGNRTADASHYIRQRATEAFVTLDVVGKGVLHFVRTNHWHGSPWRYTVDGKETVVKETTTDDPTKPVPGSTFIPQDVFPEPLAFTWSTTKGADLSWVSIPFERTLELAYSRTFYGTGYYIFHLFSEGTAKLSQPIRSWEVKPPPGEVLTLLSRSGSDIAPTAGVTTWEGSVDVAESGATEVLVLEGAKSLRALRFVAPKAQAIAFGRARLRVTWDDRAAPSIDAPIAQFFGAGTLYDRTGSREHLVKGFPSVIRYPKDQPVVELSAYWPMPFFRKARIEIVGAGEAIAGVKYHVRAQPYDGPTHHVGYFHATHRDLPKPTPGVDNVMLDTRGIEGSTDWCGHFTGMSWIFSHRAVLGTLEGDPRFFFDDALTPHAQGTGTEEWGGGGDYWGGGNLMTLPFAGHPTGANGPAAMKEPEDGIESAYRFLLSDLMPFGKNALIRLEHGGENEHDEHYQSVAYWYGLPGACLVRSDELHVGDPIDESKHAWSSTGASAPEEITSRYEWGVDFDRFNKKEVFPATTDVGRTITAPSQFTLSIPPKNLGVMLRRKFDQKWVDQRADVFVADDRDDAPFELAGTWYHPGSNTVLYGWTAGTTETTNGIPEVVTSNRRFREEELLVPRRLTEGRSKIRVRIVPVGTPLPRTPGGEVPPRIWSEIRYWAYAWTMPPKP